MIQSCIVADTHERHSMTIQPDPLSIFGPQTQHLMENEADVLVRSRSWLQAIYCRSVERLVHAPASTQLNSHDDQIRIFDHLTA